LTALGEGFQALWNAKLVPEAFRVAVLPAEDIVISLMGALDQPPAQLEERVRLKTILEKYRTRLPKSIGFGVIVPDRSRPFHSAVWMEGAWEENPEMDRILEEGPLVAPAPGSSLPSRNDPCFCDSGRKFKKCHLPKMR
jgi:hypothetical protein